MHVLYLIPQDAESPYGNGRALPIATALSQQGHQVTALMLHANFAACTPRNYAINPNLRVQVVAQSHVKKVGNQKHYFGPLQLIWVILTAIIRLVWAGQQQQADLILIGKAQPICGIAGRVLAKSKRIPCWLDADDYEAASNRFGNALQQHLVATYERRLCCVVDRVLTNTDFMRDQIKQWCPRQSIQKLPNGITTDWLDPTPQDTTSRLRQELELPSAVKVIGFIGSLSSPSHPVHLLIDAFAKIHQRQPDTHLLIVGGGEDWQALQKRCKTLNIAQACSFTGRVPPNAVKAFYSLCDVCIEPLLADDAALSRAPLKLFEAWATDTPFITSLMGERAQLYASLDTAIFPTPGNVEALASAIENALEDPTVSGALRRHGKQEIQHYTWDQIVTGLLPA